MSVANGETPQEVLEERIKKEYRHRESGGFLIQLLTAICIVYVLMGVVFGVSQIKGNSMEPSYLEGDRVVFWRLGNHYEPGDVVIFKHGDVNIIKRVIAVAGDTVDIDDREGTLYVNGELIEEDFVYSATTTRENGTSFPLTVEEGHIFVLGDNRETAADSRSSGIGQVPMEDIVGKIILIYFHDGKWTFNSIIRL